MRIRSTKPEFWRSRTVASVDWDARFVLKGLESYVDDNGVGKDDVELIVSDLFPRDLAREPSRTLARVSEAISDLHQAGLVWRYEVDGAHLLYISNWDSIQRVDKPQTGRNPRPDGTFQYKESVIRESSKNPREPSRTLAPGTGEQGNRGTGEQGSSDYVGDAVAPAAPTPPENTAQTLIAEWISHCEQRPPGRVIGQLSKEVKALLAEGIPYDDVRRGIAAWHTKSLHPSTIASVVHEVRNPPRPQQRPSTTDQRVMDAANLARRLAAQDAHPYPAEIGA